MRFTLLLVLFVLASCDQAKTEVSITHEPVNDEAVASEQSAEQATVEPTIADILDSQSEDTKARYPFRHPLETLSFCDVQASQTVAEILPGGGWYSKILLPVLGESGKLVGIDYDIDLWPLFSFTDDAFVDKRKSWSSDWLIEAKEWGIDGGATTSAYAFGEQPEDLVDSVDRVMFIRALHNLKRFDAENGFLKDALAETKRILKSDGLVCVVQHEVSEDKSDEWADGSKGYLKKSSVVSFFAEAGFELVNESSINQNVKDVPGDEDIVWRLPPTFYTSKDNDDLKKTYSEIGESNRMTLIFKISDPSDIVKAG